MARQAIPPEEIRVLDINASYLGVRTIELMEHAGEAVAKTILDSHRPGSNVAFICGKGNNGGDGFVAARHLKTTMRPEVFLVEPESEITSDVSKVNLERVRNLVNPFEYFAPASHDVIVDAMLGVGLQGRPRQPYPKYIGITNKSTKPVVSVDVPSGWPSELQVHPDMTVTFHAPKVGMNEKNSGRIVVADIGIPVDAERFCGPGEFSLLPRRRKDSHKGDAGRVLWIVGGPYTGAPAFTGIAAMRSGVDLAFVATPESAATAVAIYSPNIIVKPLAGEVLVPGHVPDLLALSKEVDCVAIGPGLGAAPETTEAVESLIARIDKPMVIDADAIAVCGRRPKILKGRSGVITPHAGEFKKLTGKALPKEDLETRSRMVKDAAAKLKMTVLQKGPIDVISDGRFLKLNRTGNDAMTVGGTGDVLTGIVSGLIAQKATPFAAARIGAFTAGVAGDLAFDEKSYGLLATDVIEKVPFVLRRYL